MKDLEYLDVVLDNLSKGVSAWPTPDIYRALYMSGCCTVNCGTFKMQNSLSLTMERVNKRPLPPLPPPSSFLKTSPYDTLSG